MPDADPAAASLLDRARSTRDDLEARLLLAAAVSRVARGVGVQVVVTGGTAVDFYAAGAAGTSESYPLKWRPSGDVDLIVLATRERADARDALARALSRDLALEPQVLGSDPAGHERLGRGIEVPDFGFGLELVSDELRRDPRGERVFTVEVENEPVIFQGPEDTLLAYAESGWHFRAPRDWERALAVARAMRAELDEDYLARRAEERGMPEVLRVVLAGEPLPRDAGRLR